MILANTSWSLSFFLTSILLGVALAMDAFSVSVASAFSEPNMSRKKEVVIASTFALFQFVMPLIGWVLIHYLVEYFNIFRHFIPWIALGLLTFLGVRMLISYHRNQTSGKEEDSNTDKKKHSFVITLLIQGIATSIDALSVGLNTAEYAFPQALVCSAIILVITFIICMIGLILGKTVGDKVGSKAELIGGIILIVIGVFICVKGEISLYVPAEYIPDFLKFIF